MRQLLAERPRGKGQVRLVSWLENGQEVEIVLPGHYQLDAAMIADLRRLPGITDVRAG
jgi:DNA polymerase-3 subunit alpha